ncbi:MAG: acetyltransferase [Planctomycetaceae bacterium]
MTTTMLMRERESGDLIRINDIDCLFDPFQLAVQGRSQAGEEEQEEIEYRKAALVFPSGEPLPLCWLDPDYQISA